MPVGPSRAVGTGIDVVFPVLHGRFGEDGTIQGLLEMVGVPYVGAGVFASAAAMDKEFTKKLLAAEGLSVGEYVVVRPGRAVSRADLEHLGLPVFVKPARSGSSVGISKVTDWDSCRPRSNWRARHDAKVIIEAGVVGREIEVGVLEDADGRPKRVCRPRSGWCAVMIGTTSRPSTSTMPASSTCRPTSTDPRLRLYRSRRVRAFEALDCAGLARVDFFLRADGELIVNEVNTMPGFTPISMFPEVWAASGVDYPTLVDRLIRTALRRAGR